MRLAVIRSRSLPKPLKGQLPRKQGWVMAKTKILRPRERASWRGMLRFGLVAFPVQAFNALLPQHGHVSFHQLHAKCHSRIRHEKTCPIHGKVENSEIVSGYEYARGKYVEIAEEELDELRTAKEKSLT